MPRLRFPCHRPVPREPELSTDATTVHGLLRLTAITTSLRPGVAVGTICISTSWLATRFICSRPCSRSRRFNNSPGPVGNAVRHVPHRSGSAKRISPTTPGISASFSVPVVRSCSGTSTRVVT
ncbi:hypothetical protein D3C87_1731920 [compost metagenome]